MATLSTLWGYDWLLLFYASRISLDVNETLSLSLKCLGRLLRTSGNRQLSCAIGYLMRTWSLARIMMFVPCHIYPLLLIGNSV